MPGMRYPGEIDNRDAHVTGSPKDQQHSSAPPALDSQITTAPNRQEAPVGLAHPPQYE